MKANKTQPNTLSVNLYLDEIENLSRKKDAEKLTQLMEQATKAKPVMWGNSIVGYGSYHYIYASGREGDTAAVGFAARKHALVIYGLFHYAQNSENIVLAEQLGTHTHGKGCLYIKQLSEINLTILKQMISNAYNHRARRS